MSLSDDVGKSSRSNRVIFCTNVLPITLNYNETTNKWECSFDEEILFEDGPMYVEMGSILHEKEGYEVLYIGVPPCFVEEEQQPHVEHVLHQLNCYPVWLSRESAHNHFQGFCKGILWPSFHNIIDLYSNEVDFAFSSSSIRSNASPPNSTSMSSNNLRLLNEKQNTTSQVNKHNKISQNWFPPRQWSPMESEICWPDHCGVNSHFVDKVIEVYADGDIVWIHDYHLLLMPSFLLRKLPKANVGLFLHIPFPSSECFRVLANRDDILRAMLCADHIGFHVYEYARHFLTCCKRMLGLGCEGKAGGVISVSYQHRNISVTCTHIGPTPERILSLSRSVEPAAVFDKLKSNREGARRLILGIDEVEGLRGISLKLLAFDRYLEMYGDKARNVVLKQIGVKLDSRPGDYQKTTREVIKLMAKINEKYRREAVIYEEVSVIGIKERISYYKATDLLMVTAIREGLNMIPFEYIVATGDKPGCIILSEFSACSRVLFGAMKANPFKTEELAILIDSALDMEVEEKTARRSRDLNTIETNTLHHWCKRIVKDIKIARKPEESEGYIRYGLGFGIALGNSVLNASKEKKLEVLDTVKVCESYKSAKRRLILFDYSGTLVDTSSMSLYLKKGGAARVWHYQNGGSRRPGGCLETRDPLPERMKKKLQTLCADPNNTVVVISADLRDELEHALIDIPNLAMIAENGFVFRLDKETAWESVLDESGSGVWYTAPKSASSLNSSGRTLSGDGNPYEETTLADIGALDDPELDGWQDRVLSVMLPYAERTNAAFCWKAPSAVSFNFVLSDPELGFMQADILFTELEAYLAGLPLSLEKGKGYCTVRLAGVNRGAAAAAIMAKINRQLRLGTSSTQGAVPKIDFVLGIGDDIEDEPMFTTMEKYKAGTNAEATIFGTKVGFTNKPTAAKFYVDDSADVETLLTEIIDFLKDDSSQKVRRSASIHHLDSTIPLAEQYSSNFVTKRSMLSIAAERKKNSIQRTFKPGLETIKSSPEETADEELSKPELSVKSRQIATWDILEQQNLEKDVRKASGLANKEKKKNKRVDALKEKVKKNVSFKNLPATPEDSEKEKKEETMSKSIPHSASYIATREEINELFGGNYNASTSSFTSLNKPGIPVSQPVTKPEATSTFIVPDTRAIPPTRSSLALNNLKEETIPLVKPIIEERVEEKQPSKLTSPGSSNGISQATDLSIQRKKVLEIDMEVVERFGYTILGMGVMYLFMKIGYKR